MSGLALDGERARERAGVTVGGGGLVNGARGALLHIAGRARALAAVAVVGEPLVLIADGRLGVGGGRDVRAADERQAEHCEGHRGEPKRLHRESPWRWTLVRAVIAEGRPPAHVHLR